MHQMTKVKKDELLTDIYWFAHDVAKVVLVLKEGKFLQDHTRSIIIEGMVKDFLIDQYGFKEEEILNQIKMIGDYVNIVYFSRIDDTSKVHGFIVGVIDGVLSCFVEDQVEIVK